MKLMGATLAASLLFTMNVHAEEVEELDNSEDITTISDGIDTLDEKVDVLNNNCQDEGVSDDISDMSSVIDILNDTISRLSNNYSKLLLTINKNKYSIISGLNKSVYANNKISENASYSDVISKINDIKYQGTLDVTPDDNGKYTFESGYYEGGTIDISAIVEAARQEAREEGLKEGKEEGLKEGKEEGFKEGKEEGLKEGKEEALKEGREEGYKAGKEDGLKEGLADGDKAGYSRGLADGDKAGYSRGLTDGDRAGYSRGLTDGKRQGEASTLPDTISFKVTSTAIGVINIPVDVYKNYNYYAVASGATTGMSDYLIAGFDYVPRTGSLDRIAFNTRYNLNKNSTWLAIQGRNGTNKELTEFTVYLYK
ncbi:hypothetical protein SAMN05216540_11072 [Butyrivibrio sp. M55]|nr:hypothetical protein SAMN05216540_11072 [Butyrivibrio sp. M55]